MGKKFTDRLQYRHHQGCFNRDYKQRKVISPPIHTDSVCQSFSSLVIKKYWKKLASQGLKSSFKFNPLQARQSCKQYFNTSKDCRKELCYLVNVLQTTLPFRVLIGHLNLNKQREYVATKLNSTSMYFMKDYYLI